MSNPTSMLTLHALLSDNAVLQRGQPIALRGHAKPGAQVAVHFDGETASVTADANGYWQAKLRPRDASGPHTLAVESDNTRLERKGIYLGEVWLGSGQSNMDWPLASADDAVAEIHGARFPELHLFKVPQRPSLQPETDVAAEWKVCSPETVKEFSAVLYHFGRRLLPEVGCHIGLIHSAWGGSCALPWTPRAAIEREPTLAHAIEQINNTREIAPPAPMVQHPDTGNTGEAKGWARMDCPDAAWPTLPIPCYWQHHGLHFNGAVWFRREVKIPAEWAGRDLTLSLGIVDDFDTTYFNGEFIGGIGAENPAAWRTPRFHNVPGRLVKAGRANIAVRVYDWFGEGGMVGPAGAMRIFPKDETTLALSLAGDWRFQIERAIPLPTASGQAEGHTIASALFNGMIAPLTGFPLRGFLWYQGESDAARAALYPTIQKVLIEGWRTAWRDAALPFYLVQLAPYRQDSPFADDEWPELREAQALTAAAVPQTDYIVTLDCGDPYDIHPGDKRTVGRRLAALALANTYQRPLPHCGPRYLRHEIAGDVIRVEFSHYEPNLRTSDGGALRGFSIAGEDKQFLPAEAVIEGVDTVVVRHPKLKKPVAVRYAWCAAPVTNLENASSLPAAPFRTDTWPRVTEGRK
jgi:sialate O-acetylesterase